MASIRRITAAQAVIFVTVAFIAVLVRLTLLLHSNISFAFFLTDSFEYLQLADGIRHGCGFARFLKDVCEAPEVLRTPGYPLFLAPMPSVRWALAAQGLIGGVVCLLVAKWVANDWSFEAALFAELMIALDVSAIVLASEVMAETLFQFFVVVALMPPIVVIWRSSETPPSQTKIRITAVVCGLLAGGAVLVRPVGIIIPLLLPFPFLLAPVLSLRQRLVAGAIAFLIPSLIVVAWAARNYNRIGYPGLSTVGAVNMYYYRAGEVVARLNGVSPAEVRDLLGARLGVPYDRVYDSALQSRKLTRRMNQLAFQILKAHPVQSAMMTLQSCAYLALAPMRSELAVTLGSPEAHYVPLPHDGEGMWVFANEGINAGIPSTDRLRNKLRMILRTPSSAVLIFYQALLVVILWIGIIKAVVRCAKPPFGRRIWTLYPLASGTLLLMLAAGGEAAARFRAPVLPLLAITSSLGYFPRRAAKDG
jgi:hypothetical protein